MKVPVWYEPEPMEIDVDISLEDIRNALSGYTDPESVDEALRLLGVCASVLRSVPDVIIQNFNEKQKETITNFLTEQAKRYS